ncbi:MAG: DUF1822 family protein [Geitlerinemataceae cyanobacterium]
MTESLAFTVPLTIEAHQIARQLSSAQFVPKRAKRAYLNSLAVYATRFYLQCMEIESDCFFDRDPSMPTIEACSVLEISDIGKLECCPILESDRTARIPAETWGDRIGYIIVQFNESLTHANLLGFIQKTTLESVPLDRLESLETFLTYITELEESQPANSIQEQKTVKLSQWWYDTVETGWGTLDALFPRTQFAWRNSPVPTDHSKHSVTRAKILNLARHDRVALALALLQLNNSEIEIWVEIYPLQPNIYLPENLKLSVLDEMGVQVIQAEARTTENIQIKFVADPGELFGVRVSLEEVSVTESFVV